MTLLISVRDQLSSNPYQYFVNYLFISRFFDLKRFRLIFLNLSTFELEILEHQTNVETRLYCFYQLSL